MRKIWLIVKREYLTRVRTKAFVWGTIAVPLFTVGIFVFQIIVASKQPDHSLKIAILDNSGGLSTLISGGLTEKLKNGQPVFRVVETIERPASEESVRRDLLAEVRQHQLDAFLVVPQDAAAGTPAEFHTRNPGELMLTRSMNRAVSDAVVAQRLESRGVAVADVTSVVKGVDLKLIKITRWGESVVEEQMFITAIISGMLLYVTLIIYGVATMRSVMEEKTTRIIEMLVASVRPFYLLSGKILGVAGVALTQYLIWTVAGALVAGYGATMAAAFRPDTRMPKIHLPASLLVYLVVFFLAGYVLYASLYAAVGAMVSTDQEAQQMQTPLTMIIVLSFLLFNVILQDPNSRLSTILSLIPFLSPILMILRIAMQTPPFWQIALSLALSLLTTIGVVYFSARIYRVGVLMYGKRPSLLELVRWLRYT
ncbi:MAG TPA: ABC transporter permease [Terriglobia bacterium]|nr:ABC transporter permease [Terriglobia bacterium]